MSRTIPVFSVDGEKGYGFNEETKPMLKHLMVLFLGMIAITLSYPRLMAKPMVDGFLLMGIILRV